MSLATRARSAAGTARRFARNADRKGLRPAARMEELSVTRLCRCGPLLSNRSNKWDEL